MDPATRALALFLARELESADHQVGLTRTLPVMTAREEGRRDGLRTALAYMAGQHGFAGADDPIAWLVEKARLDDAIPEGEARALDGNR